MPLNTFVRSSERRLPHDRRGDDRPLVSAQRRDRRGEERRDSPRIAMLFWVRELDEGGSYQERDGELALEGAIWFAREKPSSDAFEVRFRLPKQVREMRVAAKLFQVREVPGGYACHVSFPEMSAMAQLSLARYLSVSPNAH